MTDNFIQLNKTDILRLGIKDEFGKDTGEYLSFDLEDIELPLKYQEMLEKDKKNREQLRNQLVIIDKKQDVKGKKLLSKNEEDRIRAIKDFYKKQEEAYNLFLGKDGVKKLLNGRDMNWTIFEELDSIIVEQILPYINVSMEKISEKIKNKYGVSLDNANEILK